MWLIAAIAYSACVLFGKLSIMLLYRRLFPTDNFRLRWWTTLFVTVGYSIGGIFSSLFACTPVSMSWDVTITSGHCINKGAFYVANGILNAVTDLAVLALPIPIIWKLSLGRKQKIILSALFIAGSL